jgi:hypothetical protein
MVFIAWGFAGSAEEKTQKRKPAAVGENVTNRYNWDYPSQWAGFNSKCEKLNAGSIEFEIINSSPGMFFREVDNLVEIGTHKAKGKNFGKMLVPIVIEPHKVLAKIKSMKSQSSCLKVGSIIVLSEEELQ